MKRLATFTVFGVLWTGGFNHYWYGLCGRGRAVLASRFTPLFCIPEARWVTAVGGRE
jgi:hypothetical protein